MQFLDVRMALGLRRADGELALSLPAVWPSLASTRSAPGIRFSKLDSSPVDASVYTSPGTSRHPAQDSRSRWFATPFLWGSFIPDCTPVYPDDCVAVGMAVAGHPPHRPVLAGTTAYGSYLGFDSFRNLA
jgi:hypothetical protein